MLKSEGTGRRLLAGSGSAEGRSRFPGAPRIFRLSAVAIEMFEITQRLPSCALEQVLAFVHLLDEVTTVDARTTVKPDRLQLVITAPIQDPSANREDGAGRRRSA